MGPLLESEPHLLPAVRRQPDVRRDYQPRCRTVRGPLRSALSLRFAQTLAVASIVVASRSQEMLFFSRVENGRLTYRSVFSHSEFGVCSAGTTPIPA